MIEERTVELPFGRLAYRQAGIGGRPVVLLHGNSMSSRAFGPLMEAATGRELRLLAADLPGHGGSSDAAEAEATYTLPGYADVVSGFLDAQGADGAVVVGHSLGGHVALELAGRRADIAGVMVVGAPPIPNDAERAMAAYRPTPFLEICFKPDLDAAETEAFAAGAMAPAEPVPEFAVADVARTDPRAREMLAKSIFEGDFLDEVELVSKLKQPLCVALGRDDPYVDEGYLSALDYRNLWRKKVTTLTGGHAPFWDDPAGFGDLLGRFVADLSP